MVLAALVLATLAGSVERDAFGVPHILAPDLTTAYRLAGRSVAEDRLWQMESSRRLARGRMSEVFGTNFVEADRSALRNAYTLAELEAQYARLSPTTRLYFEAYAAGVNEHIAHARQHGSLPPGYATHEFVPEPWTPLDSVAIAIRLLRQFGSGGGGELRNLAAYQYLRTQAVRDQVLDAFDDLLPPGDPRSLPTLGPANDPLSADPPTIARWTRADTEHHLADTPMPSLLELLPAIRAANDPAILVAQELGLPHRWGSYAIVVPASRSASGRAMLVSGPQMGHSTPSVIHEMSISTPELRIAGMGVPGVPGILIGHTDRFAWGLTTAVTDMSDVFWHPVLEDGRYRDGDTTHEIETIEFRFTPKGGSEQVVTQTRTTRGPVVLNSRSARAIFAERSAYFGRELVGLDTLFTLHHARNIAEIAEAVPRIPVGFNLFVATVDGDIGYFLCGAVPRRAPGYDPRLPLPARPEADWRGFLEPMPQGVRLETTVLTNWNNKPTSWWPNLDTPVWNRIFRNEVLVQALPTDPNARLTPADLERALWNIARQSENHAYFQPLFLRALETDFADDPAFGYLRAYDGWNLEGLVGPTLFNAVLEEVRRELFADRLGNFLNPGFFAQVVQPSLIYAALMGETNIDYLQGRTPEAVIRQAFRDAIDRLSRSRSPSPADWGYSPSTIGTPAGRVPYSDRGTYLQIVEMSSPPRARTVLSPGNAETGPHSADQVPLLREWRYKPMGFRTSANGAAE